MNYLFTMFVLLLQHHRGKVLGLQIWVLGIFDRDSGRSILYPVADRSRETLIREYMYAIVHLIMK